MTNEMNETGNQINENSRFFRKKIHPFNRLNALRYPDENRFPSKFYYKRISYSDGRKSNAIDPAWPTVINRIQNVMSG